MKTELSFLHATLHIDLFYNPTKNHWNISNIAELRSRNENEVKYVSGTYIENKDQQSCHSCMRHSALTFSTIIPSTIKIFLTVAELCSGNQTEEKIWLRVVNLVCNNPLRPVL